MLTEIYYEVDDFNKKHLEKIAAYAATIDWYSKREFGCMSMSEIMIILIYYHYSHYKNFKSYYKEHVSKELTILQRFLQGLSVLLTENVYIYA